MYAALKSRASAYIIFQGGSSGAYPRWFSESIEQHTYLNEYGYHVAELPYRRYVVKDGGLLYWDDLLVEGYDIFIRNHQGSIRRIDMDILEESYEVIADGTIAYRDDCVEYVIFYKEMPDRIYPEWFVNFYVETLKEKVENDPSFPEAVVVLYKVGGGRNLNYQILDVDLFQKNYFYSGNGIDWEGFECYSY